MVKKRISERTWYFYFGFAGALVVLGFFWIFSYYAHMPDYIKQSIIDNPPTTSSELIIQKPPFPYLGVFMAIFGTITFLISKYFYDKEGHHVKRTTKHG
jgi:hypothetical protein